ncbi:sensor histidine kinase [Actinoplanes sp. G11-F43]|uniref:sensor histidine kinase n=1 Tax=Actinoplanes sp. G11-F43 TaxID=3424130 RepID=UPI003D35785A
MDLGPAGATAVLFLFSGTAVSVPLAVTQLLPLLWRRRWPAVVLIVVAGATAAHTTLGMARAIGFFPATIALYSAAAHRSPWLRWVLCPAAGTAMAAASALRHGVVEGALMAVVTVTVAWLAGVERGDHLRQRAEADRLRREREVADRERAVAEDRERLARRVHDTVAHTVTVMLVQTEAVRATAALDPAAERRLDNVLHAGRRALTEIRAALTEHEQTPPQTGHEQAPPQTGHERPPAPAEHERKPTPTGHDRAPSLTVPRATPARHDRAPSPAGPRAIPAGHEQTPSPAERLENLRAAGLRLVVPDLGDVLPPRARGVAERLIGEAATNALRHDGPGTLLTVTATMAVGAVTLTARTEPGGSAPARAGGGPGFGLRSLAADLHTVGGTLVFGPADPSGWRVEATIPHAGSGQ